MSNALKDPEDVIEMRKSLAEFGRVVRKGRQSNSKLPRVEVESPREREDETTKKMGIPNVAR